MTGAPSPAEPGDAGDAAPLPRPRWATASIVVGLGALAFGCWELLTGGSATLPAVPWLAGSLAVHDALLAPAAAVVALVLVGVLPADVRRVVAVGLFVAVSLVLVASPALRAPGVAGNPSAVPRDYPLGLTVALAGVACATLLAVLVTVAARRVRRGRRGAGRRNGGRRRPTGRGAASR